MDYLRENKMFKVSGACQNYAWGRLGLNSWVSLFESSVNPSLPYAEYWLGTHPSLPSRIESELLSLRTGNLPYLFKVLSIGKPLSIQVHPSKAQALDLHRREPEMYPDDNYKPEMCIARGRLRLFFGIRPEDERREVLNNTPELLQLVGPGDLRSQLENLYKDEEKTREAIREYSERVKSGVYHEINQFFPLDPGVFFAMFMNYLELDDGQALIIDAGVPHCYIEGECIEAMACSDNVVRAGLTPKAKDVKTLLEVTNI
jgi:mannose-6-phosphate isomerase